MPRIYQRSDVGLRPLPPYLPLGRVRYVTLHHSAGPRPDNFDEMAALIRTYDAMHARDWPSVGGIGYHLCMDKQGRLYYTRNKSKLGAHVGLHNSNNFGISVFGNYDLYEYTLAQKRTLKALYRGEVRGFEFMGGVPWRGHQEWSGHTSNACPGRNGMKTLRWLRAHGHRAIELPGPRPVQLDAAKEL